jgi:hypothetical protein
LIVARSVAPRPDRRARRALSGASRSAPRAACAACGGAAHPRAANTHDPYATIRPPEREIPERTPSGRHIAAEADHLWQAGRTNETNINAAAAQSSP